MDSPTLTAHYDPEGRPFEELFKEALLTIVATIDIDTLIAFDESIE